jgi:choline dehydrogenase-like flavoprotein
MIVSPDELIENSVIEADLCIVGSGPAGLSIALELKDSGKKIVIVTGGDMQETAFNQDLNRGIIAPENSHEPLDENRRRIVGGASTVWGGRCIPFDDIDFEKRSWVNNSGWPFNYNAIANHYARANKILEAGQYNYDAVKSFASQTQTQIINGLDDADIVSTKLERWSTPTNFAKEYYGMLNGSPNITILLNTHVLKINTQDGASAVTSVTAVANKKQFTIHAKNYVLACGGIENPRLLLASKNEFYPNGIGNNNDVVGRYYMGHINGIFAEVSPKNREQLLFNFEIDDESVYCRRRWWITQKAQQQHQIGNVIFFLQQSTNQDGHRDVLFSTVYVAKYILSVVKQKSFSKAKQSWGLQKKEIKEHLVNILKNGWKQLPTLFGVAIKRFKKRRLPFVLPSVKSKTLGLYFQSEQVPTADSRVTLSNTEFDAFGLPRAVVQIKFSDIDKKTIIESHKIFIEKYLAANAGEVKCNFDELPNFIEQRINKYNSAAHNLGTTRISTDPLLGVVDADCKVHGIDNLYIAGASVFPTGGHANPTLTIVALALKLADFLKNK